MKKTILILLISTFLAPLVQSQKTLTGTVDYSYKIAGEGAEAMAGMMPEKMIIKYGENGLVMEMKGGMMASMMGKTVVNGETGEAFMVKDSEETIYLMSNDDIKSEAEKLSDPNIQKFEDTKKILGYKCKKYIQTTIVQGASVSQTIWVTKDLVLPDYNSEAFKGIAGQGTMNFNIDGFPMLIEVGMPGLPVTMVLQVTNIEFGKINKSEFEKPAGYTTKSFSEMNLF